MEVNLQIRAEREEDYVAIHEVNALAFGRENEALLVEALREALEAIPELSLVAVMDKIVVGYILFSRIAIETAAGDVPALSLAPVAVLPEYQNQGIGSQLVRRGLEECRLLGHPIVIVLGHANYYPRFGFFPARAQGIECPYEVGDEFWMAQELVPGVLQGIRGKVRYPPAFNDVE